MQIIFVGFISDKEKAYAFFIRMPSSFCCLPDDKKLNLVIFHALSGQKLTASQEYYEIGLYELNEILQEITGDKQKYSCSIVKVKNNFGFNMRMIYPKQTVIHMEDDNTNG